MESSRAALFLALFVVTCASATAYASGTADGKSDVNYSGTPNAAAHAGDFILAQGATGDRNSCLSACQDKNQGCMAQIDPSCNSKGCNNERRACTEQYNECSKACAAR